MPFVAHAMEVEKPDANSLTVDGETETITIAGQSYFLWPVPVEKIGLQVLTAIPDGSKGLASHMTVGAPMEYDEVIKVLEVHYRRSAFDFDSLKLRNVASAGIRYVSYCTTSFLCNQTFRAGNLVELESNGRNRLGGMTGFTKETYLITKIPTGAINPSAETRDQYDGKLPRATSDELRVGMGYIGDHRTETTVLIAASDTDGAVNVQAAVGGILRISVPFGSGSADATLTCKSTGVLEQEIATKIAARLNDNHRST